MKTKTWKWDGVDKRLVQMGVTSKKAVDCGKKWDNLYQKFKTVHKFMGESRKPNFFTLTPGERKELGFDFRMDERVYLEMTAMSRGDHTIHPTNLADTGAAGGVQMAGPHGGRNESDGSEGCGDGQDDDQGSTRDSTFSGGGGCGGGKRKNVRQQTFNMIADVMKDHENLMAMTVDSASKRQCSILTRQCDILERELEVQKEHYVKADQANFMMCNAAGVVVMEARVSRQLPAVVGQGQARHPLPLQHAGASGGGKTPSAQKGEEVASDSRTTAADHTTTSGLAEGAEEGRVDDVRRDYGRRDGKWEGDDDDDHLLVTRLKGATKEDDLEVRSKLWVDRDAFWGRGPGKPLREVIEDPAQCEPALYRARSVEKLVLCTIHGWIFKSSLRRTGFARAESYITLDLTTNVARAVWQRFEWSKVLSPALAYHTLAMKMDVPPWFVGVKIVDRLEDDDMAARQEATVLRRADCWTYVVWCGQWADSGRMKQERLSRDCLRALFNACTWIMHMGGDDDRSHYEAWFYASMVAKPTMIAAGSYIFNWRRHIVDTANLVLDRLGKAHLTLGDYPLCILEWSDCRLVFGHNAALKNAAEAAKHGWIGSRPGPRRTTMEMRAVDSWVRPEGSGGVWIVGGLVCGIRKRRTVRLQLQTLVHGRDGCPLPYKHQQTLLSADQGIQWTAIASKAKRRGGKHNEETVVDAGKGKSAADCGADGGDDSTDGDDAGGGTQEGVAATPQNISQPRAVWNEAEQLLLVRCKIDYGMEEESRGRSSVKRFKSKDTVWCKVTALMAERGVVKEQDACSQKWDSLMSHMRRVRDYERKTTSRCPRR
ncbi:hypothetical protein CBR_g21269 [Chara braunii]|uniref:Myb/SANT-like DNA-binding domain-containing protein n=1 Tax=Chara braunii TaxID=69332 RepID=A0A388L156_CHABU|nr:hypothetical protein CBR_g21269 [Chara braunii]|eukprot:GBG76029.1 hypothetical protein CBR_g21269 [Chara braunii]